MIAMMERCAAMLALEQLEDGQATVGFEVCIKHVAGAGEGAQCTVTAKLDRVEDGRKFFFDVEVREGERVLGVGTHQRRLVAGAMSDAAAAASASARSARATASRTSPRSSPPQTRCA